MPCGLGSSQTRPLAGPLSPRRGVPARNMGHLLEELSNAAAMALSQRWRHNVRRSHRKGLFERVILSLLRLRPYRCEECDKRFFGYGDFVSGNAVLLIPLGQHWAARAGYLLDSRLKITGSNNDIQIRLTPKGPVFGVGYCCRTR